MCSSFYNLKQYPQIAHRVFPFLCLKIFKGISSKTSFLQNGTHSAGGYVEDILISYVILYASIISEGFMLMVNDQGVERLDWPVWSPNISLLLAAAF